MTAPDDQSPPHPSDVVTRRRPLAFAAILTVVFATFLTAALARHEIWRDEAKAWLIARDSTSLANLLHNRRYEGHPILWYVPLYAASRFTRDPAAMQVIHGAIASAAVFAFALCGPFGRAQKVLFAAGVFPLYEYGVVSRCYAQGALLLFVLLTLFGAARRRPILVATLLALLALSNLYGLLIAIAYAGSWVMRDLRSRRSQPASGTSRGWRDATAAVVFAAGVTAAFFQVVPPPPVHAPDEAGRFAVVGEERFAGGSLSTGIAGVWKAYVPVPRVTGSRWMYTNALEPTDGRIQRAAIAAASLALVAAAAVLLWPVRHALVLYLSGTGMLIAFAWLKFPGALRHHGHLYLILLAAAWMAMPSLTAGRRKAFSVALTALLALHAAAGAWFYTRDLREPYAPGRATARFLAERYGRDFDLVADPANFAAPACALLDVPVYFPARRAFGTYELLDGTPKRAAPAELSAALRELRARSDRPLVLMTNLPFANVDPDLRLVPIFSSGATLSMEHSELYEVYRTPKAGAGPASMRIDDQ